MNVSASAARPIQRFHLNLGFARRRRWLLVTATVLSCFFFLTALSRGGKVWILLTAGAALLCSFACGYAFRAFQQPFSPSLPHLKRHQYEQVWNSLAASRELAGLAAAGERGEEDLRRSVQSAVQNLVELARISQSDDVLEIGCGIGRVGRELAAHCKTWTGCDISRNMLGYARERFEGVGNVRFVLLGRGNLSVLESQSFDVVFATNMLGHLDEIDRWCYVEDAFRVLRPSGRLFIDNIDLESDAGWTMFTNDVSRFHELERPPYFPRFSTASEFVTYASRAGFQAIAVHRRQPLVVITAEKPCPSRQLSDAEDR
jgi:ubiquinone/menaquinone biosynthesis C-methylase UbiE